MAESPGEVYRLLHIDDSEDFLEQFCSVFGNWFDITGRGSAKEAIDILREKNFDCAIVDYEMPGTNGLELLEIIRRQFPAVPVILYTGQGNELVARQAFKAGASDYFVKDIKIIEQREKLINSVRNAIEKQQMERLLHQERSLLDNIIELNPYSIQIFSNHGKLVQQNRAAARIFGTGHPPKIDLKRIVSLLCKSEFKSFYESIKNGISLRIPPAWINMRDLDSDAPEGTVCLGAVSFSLTSPQGEILNHVMMYEDITDQARAREELQNTLEKLEIRVEERTAQLAKVVKNLEKENDQRKKLHEELTDTVKRLKKEIDERSILENKLNHKNKELEEFAFRISHDLRNSILILKRLSEDSIRDPDQRGQNFNLFLDTSNQLIKYTEDLLDLARAGKIIREKSTINLYDLAMKVFLLSRPKGIRARLEFEDREAVIFGEPWGLENAITNLIMNSIIYRDPHKEELIIRITYRKHKGKTIACFSDNGIGVDGDFLENIFIAGFKAHKGRGSGFGLTITKKIIEAHGGSITAHSAGPGSGTEITITLPAEPC